MAKSPSPKKKASKKGAAKKKAAARTASSGGAPSGGATSGVARLRKAIKRTVTELDTLRTRNHELEEEVRALGKANAAKSAPAPDEATLAQLEKARTKLEEENVALRRRAAELEKASKALEAEKLAALEAGDEARSALAELEGGSGSREQELAWQDERRELRQRVESLVAGLEKVASRVAEASR